LRETSPLILGMQDSLAELHTSAALDGGAAGVRGEHGDGSGGYGRTTSGGGDGSGDGGVASQGGSWVASRRQALSTQTQQAQTSSSIPAGSAVYMSSPPADLDDWIIGAWMSVVVEEFRRAERGV